MDILKMLQNESQEGDSAYMDHGYVKIINNAFFFGDSVIQISNITRIWIGEVEKKPLAGSFYLGLIAAVISFVLGVVSNIFFLLVLVFGIFCAVKYYQYKQQESNYGMQIEMNSGRKFAFFSNNRDFLQEIQDTVTKVFLREKNVTKVFNLDNSQTTNIEHIEKAGIVSTGDHAENHLNNEE